MFGQPGAGKSTGAAYIFSMLKMKGVNAELVTEFAKDKTWEGSEAPFENQTYLLGQQSYRLSRCKDQVDVIVTDSPIPLSVVYNRNPAIQDSLTKHTLDIFNTYNNMNFLILRDKKYNPAGRIHTESESDLLGDKIKNLLNTYEIPYRSMFGNKKSYDSIVDEVIAARRIKEMPNRFIFKNYYKSSNPN